MTGNSELLREGPAAASGEGRDEDDDGSLPDTVREQHSFRHPQGVLKV